MSHSNHQQHKDPICGMIVDRARAAGSSKRDGQTFYFCSKGCKAKFAAQAQGAAQSPKPPAPSLPASPAAAPVAGNEWTCPMHPEVVRDKPGSCPICGMALEPRTVTL